MDNNYSIKNKMICTVTRMDLSPRPSSNVVNIGDLVRIRFGDTGYMEEVYAVDVLKNGHYQWIHVDALEPTGLFDRDYRFVYV
jgi:hypothetical protein